MIMKKDIVFVKLEIAVSINSEEQKEDRKKGFHCLCDFTIIKKVGDKIGQTECDTIADHVEFLPYDHEESAHATCQKWCDEHLHQK